MKKLLLIGSGLMVAAAATADVPAPETLGEFYSTKIASSGKVIASQGDEVCAYYNTDTKDIFDYEFFYLGNGNCFSADGKILVGVTNDVTPVYIVDGVMQDLSKLTEQYPGLSFDGVTPDGTRIVGIATNPSTEPNETMYVPIYCDINSDGTLGEIQFLPYPKKDFTGRDIQRAKAIYISDDGKTIAGQIVDYSGNSLYPIIYTCNDDNKWSYTLPTQNLINPNKRPIPECPAEFNEPMPQYEDYMTEDEIAAYYAAVNAWYETFEGDFPEVGSFMTPEEAAAYNAAAEAYNEKVYAYNDAYNEYSEKLNEILDESLFFAQNQYAMTTDGKTLVLNAAIQGEDDPMLWFPVMDYPAYTLDIATGELKEITPLENGTYPLVRQVLSDGTIIATVPAGSYPPTTYVVAPGSNEFTPFIDYFATKNATGAEWLKKNFTKTVAEEVYNFETDEFDLVTYEMIFDGLVNVSDDWSVVSGGTMAYLYSNAYTYESYIIYGSTGGVGSVSADAQVVSKIFYNLNGIEVKEPSTGLYIERTTFSDGTSVATKKVVK